MSERVEQDAELGCLHSTLMDSLQVLLQEAQK